MICRIYICTYCTLCMYKYPTDTELLIEIYILDVIGVCEKRTVSSKDRVVAMAQLLLHGECS